MIDINLIISCIFQNFKVQKYKKKSTFTYDTDNGQNTLPPRKKVPFEIIEGETFKLKFFNTKNDWKWPIFCIG